MGQRLNIEIVNGEKVLANCYYHWSAYTRPALELTKIVIEEYQNSDMDIGIGLAVSLLEATGGGITEEERININKKSAKYRGIKFRDAISRNEGLISVTENGIEETRGWEEGRVTIDLDSKTFNLQVAYVFSIKEYEDEFKDWFIVPTDELPKCKFNLSSVPFTDIDDLIRFVDENPNGAINENKTIYQWVI